MKKDSKRCRYTTTPESIHTKDESKRGSAFAFIFGSILNWPILFMWRNDKFHGIHDMCQMIFFCLRLKKFIPSTPMVPGACKCVIKHCFFLYLEMDLQSYMGFLVFVLAAICHWESLYQSVFKDMWHYFYSVALSQLAPGCYLKKNILINSFESAYLVSNWVIFNVVNRS